MAGIGFTVSLLIASRAFSGPQLANAKLGILATAVLAPLLAGLAFRTPKQAPQAGARPPKPRLPDLATDIDDAQDHVLGAADAAVTVTVYGSFGCPFSTEATASAREVMERFPGAVRYAYRHLPLDDALPGAELAAEAAEAAAAQGKFWAMHDTLTREHGAVTLQQIYGAARDAHLNLDQFFADLGRHVHRARVQRDIASADDSGVAGTPAFFINGQRYAGAFDPPSLSTQVQRALRAARAGEDDERLNIDAVKR